MGFDIFIDAKSKAWLLEVNQSPSFTTDTPLDYTIKKNLIADAVHMLNLSWKRKNKYIQQKRLEERLWSTTRSTDRITRQTFK